MTNPVLFTALSSCTLPAAITMISGISALFLTISKGVESMLGHFAGGVVLSACANELLPMLSGDDVSIGALSGGFMGGMLLMMFIRKMFPDDDDDDDDDAAKEPDFKALPADGDGAVPWGTVVPMFIDFVMDGILIGLSFAAAAGSSSDEDGDSSGSSAGLIMVISLSVEKITLGSGTTFAMKKAGCSSKMALFVVGLLAASMYVGGFFGVTVVAALKGSQIFFSAIAFGVAALLWLVIEELLAESHETKDTTLTPVFFFGGFLIPMVLDKMGGGD